MALHTSLRPIDLATGISVQQVRNYESWGLLPPAPRSKSGYRLYTQHHLAALKTARCLIGGYGKSRTVAIMQALHQGDLSAALATIDTHHGEQALKRLQMEQALSALHALAAQSVPVQRSHAGSRAHGRVGVAVWIAGKRRGRLSGSTRRKGGDMGRERMLDIHACNGECGILAENLGHLHTPFFSYFDSQEFS